jgi:hypothetical protein
LKANKKACDFLQLSYQKLSTIFFLFPVKKVLTSSCTWQDRKKVLLLLLRQIAVKKLKADDRQWNEFTKSTDPVGGD